MDMKLLVVSWNDKWYGAVIDVAHDDSNSDDIVKEEKFQNRKKNENISKIWYWNREMNFQIIFNHFILQYHLIQYFYNHTVIHYNAFW